MDPDGLKVLAAAVAVAVVLWWERGGGLEGRSAPREPVRWDGATLPGRGGIGLSRRAVALGGRLGTWWGRRSAQSDTGRHDPTRVDPAERSD